MNLLLLQIYPFLFLGSGLSALWLHNLIYSMFVVLVMIGFFFHQKPSLCNQGGERWQTLIFF